VLGSAWASKDGQEGGQISTATDGQKLRLSRNSTAQAPWFIPNPSLRLHLNVFCITAQAHLKSKIHHHHHTSNGPVATKPAEITALQRSYCIDNIQLLCWLRLFWFWSGCTKIDGCVCGVVYHDDVGVLFRVWVDIQIQESYSSLFTLCLCLCLCFCSGRLLILRSIIIIINPNHTFYIFLSHNIMVIVIGEGHKWCWHSCRIQQEHDGLVVASIQIHHIALMSWLFCPISSLRVRADFIDISAGVPKVNHTEAEARDRERRNE